MNGPSPLSGDAPFVAISRPLDAATTAVAESIRAESVPSTNVTDSFYIAISKAELGKKWFMTGYLSQFFPGNVSAGAAQSLGVKVVTFRVQNGKLYVFDASDNYKDSDTFDPTLVLEAYPVVTGFQPFQKLSNAGNYILFDPAAGLNRFGMMSDAFESGTPAVQFQIDVAFSQNFRQIADGGTWEELFTGAAAVQINDGSLANPLKASGTLGMSFRRYAEGKGFAQSDLTPTQEYFFRSDTHLLPNSGIAYNTPIKWNVYKGMEPIHWLISPSALTAAQNWPQYDIVGALKAAVTNWNQVFGFTVLDVKIAGPNDSYGQDDKNYVLYDLDPSFGAAFANWRANPNTGEIRGSSIYFSDLWVQIADQELVGDDQPVAAPQNLAPAPHAKVPTLVWDALPTQPACVMWANHLDKEIFDGKTAAGAKTPAANPKLTKKQKVENFLTHVLLHEVGHTLGLRHNFKGSLVPPSSSVMEYVLDPDTVYSLFKPADYDTAAIKLLYGQATTEPTQPFCTDEDIGIDPDCATYDATPDPLNLYFGPLYTGVLGDFLSGASPTPPNNSLNNVLKYVRAGSALQPAQAWKLALGALAVPGDKTKATNAAYLATLNFATQRLFSRLFLDSADLRGDVVEDPTPDATVTPLIVAQLHDNLTNADGLRGFDTRRLAVDVLKHMQIQAAFDALVDAKAKISTKGLTGSALNDTNDLLDRIDLAVTPYFN